MLASAAWPRHLLSEGVFCYAAFAAHPTRLGRFCSSFLRHFSLPLVVSALLFDVQVMCWANLMRRVPCCAERFTFTPVAAAANVVHVPASASLGQPGYSLAIATCVAHRNYMKTKLLSVLIVSLVVSVSSVHSESTPKLAGEWVWVLTETLVNKIVILEDGVCYASNVNVKGKWRILADKKCVEFKWDNGFTDTLSYEKSSLVLVGVNSSNARILAAKLP